MGRRKSVIWDVSKIELERLVGKSNSFSDILRGLKLSTGSGNWKILKKRLSEDKIDIGHIAQGMNSNKGRSFKNLAIPLCEMLIENSPHSRANLKRRILKDGLLDNKCSICGQLPIWNGIKMTLVIDHINGINNDNRIENLRLVCPNCNSQLLTTNRNHVVKQIKHHFCKVCGKQISIWGTYCRGCSPKRKSLKKDKVHHKIIKTTKRPPKDELESLLKKYPMTTIGKMFGVSDNAVRKWAKGYSLVMPNMRGFWAKQYSLNDRVS